MAYHLKLLSIMRRLYLVFNIIKLTAILKDLISSRCLNLLSDSIIIDEQEE